MRLGLLGGGSIARTVAEASAGGSLPGWEIVGVVGATQPPSARVLQTASAAATEVLGIDALISRSPHWVLEAAGARAVRAHLLRLLDAKVGVVVMSLGALLDEGLWDAVQLRRRRGAGIMLPSGAIGGLDVLAALNALGQLTRVELTTTKAPKGLAGAPFLTRNAISLPADRPVTVYEGSARDAVDNFPANVNVAAALSIAGIGPERTRVRIMSDPQATHTRHEILAVGDAGTVRIDIQATPHPLNPRSSYLAALSAVAALQSITR